MPRLIDIFAHDDWSWSPTLQIGPGIVRVTPSPYYKVDPNEPFAVLTFKDREPEQEPDRLVVDLEVISEDVLATNLAGMICFATKDAQPVNVSPEHLGGTLADLKVTYLLCHPDVELSSDPEQFSHLLVQSPLFPLESGPTGCTVIACSGSPGVIVQTTGGRLGAFIRPRNFCKLRLEQLARTAWDRLLTGEDPFDE